MSGSKKKRILVLRYRFIGDTILTVPFLRNLRRAFPDAYICWVVAPGSSDVVMGIPYVDELLCWDPVTIHADSRGTHKTWRDKLEFIRARRRKKFDTAYVLKRSLSSAIIAFLSGAGRRIGFDTEGRGFLLSRTVPYRHDRHEVVNFLEVLRADDVPVTDVYLEAWLTEEEKSAARSFLKGAGIVPGDTIVALHPFAANHRRSWHHDNFAELANTLQKKYRARVLVFGGKRDIDSAARLEKNISPAPVMVVGSTDLRQSMAILSMCSLLICNDSGIMHLAAALQVPLIALFGPQSPVKFGPWGEKCRVIYKAFQCSPCKQKFFSECEPSARFSPECMEAITVAEVLETVESFRVLSENDPTQVTTGDRG